MIARDGWQTENFMSNPRKDNGLCATKRLNRKIPRKPPACCRARVSKGHQDRRHGRVGSLRPRPSRPAQAKSRFYFRSHFRSQNHLIPPVTRGSPLCACNRCLIPTEVTRHPVVPLPDRGERDRPPRALSGWRPEASQRCDEDAL